jgi:uncharacterized membrane protein YqiK
MKKSLIRGVLNMFQLLVIISGICILLFGAVVFLLAKLTYITRKNERLIAQRRVWKNAK